MAKRKQSKTRSSYPAHEAAAGPTPTRFVDRAKQIFGSAELQLPPSEGAPTRQRYKLAGGQ